MTDERPITFEIPGSDIHLYVAREKAGEFVITAMDTLPRRNAYFILHVRWPTEKQQELMK